ncbi:MAG: hypothetical protein H7281_05125 [Bacteriovorax sp.]|nr:hypothetical protein [Bacteriovorax sp.]
MKIKFTKFCSIAALSTLAIFSSATAQTTNDSSSSAFNYLNVVSPLDSKSNLYQQILDEMNLEYDHIGQREAARVLQNSTTSVTGGLNSIGFSYRKPFIDFSISADRNLAPDLYDAKRWIVTDTFSIFIDASKVMSNLSDHKVIDISQNNLAAFAGIVFKRTYTWVHYANSYNEGLTTHMEKLFLPFNALQFNKIINMQTNEMVFKEDSLSVKAGGMVSAPLYSGITAMAGVLAKFEKMSRVEVVSSPSTTGIGDDVHMSYEKSKMVMAGVSIGIQADFLKILKLTLLSYDFSYELASSYKIYLNFNQNNLREMVPGNPVVEEIAQLLKNREGDLNILGPYIISEEKKIAQTIEHKYNFLLLGGSKSSKTQQIEVTTDGRVKNFFRHYYEKVKYTEDLVSRLFASVIYAITNSEASAAKMASDSKKVTIEYDSERNLLENHEDLNIKDNEQKLSMTFIAEFTTKKSTGTFGRKYRDRAVFILERYSGIDPLAVGMVQNDYLVAPFNITGQYQVNTEGIRYLNSLSMGEVFDHINGLCDEYPRNKFFNFRNLFDNCRRSLQNDYIEYFKDLSHEKITADTINSCESQAKKAIFSAAKSRAFLKDCLSQMTFKDKADWVEIPLWPLKNLTNNIVNNSNSKVHYYNLFGVQNVFFYGSFDAMTPDGRNFTTSFHEGAFKGLGAVDHYMRLENLRAPSSVVVDQ